MYSTRRKITDEAEAQALLEQPEAYRGTFRSFCADMDEPARLWGPAGRQSRTGQGQSLAAHHVSTGIFSVSAYPSGRCRYPRIVL